MSALDAARPGPDSAELDGVSIALEGEWATALVRHSLESGIYEAQERRILDATLARDDTYLELGCGLGLLATLAARRVAPGAVTGIEADPAIASIARATLHANGAVGEVRNLVLAERPASATVDFYVHEEFWHSSLKPVPGTRRIDVPVADAHETVAATGATYLMVDIEGAETILLPDGIPGCVRTLCVETHPARTGEAAQSELRSRLRDDGFRLEADRSEPPVLLFTRA